jgi:hypothetical protein
VVIGDHNEYLGSFVTEIKGKYERNASFLQVGAISCPEHADSVKIGDWIEPVSTGLVKVSDLMVMVNTISVKVSSSYVKVGAATVPSW